MNIAAVNGKAGETRSVLRREYLLHTPDAWVRTPMPFLRRGMAVVHASPRLGAGFLQYTAELERGGELDAVAEQRFCWVLEGEASVVTKGRVRPIRAGHYAYLPGGFSGRVTASGGAKLAVIEKRYEALEGVPAPAGCVGREEDTQAVPLGGDPALLVRSLLPAEFAYDFAVNTMTYEPGAALAQVEIHVMEHGLVMLEGAGTYRLGDDRYQVQAGDFIWMAPYCPQWFVAEGDVPAKYLIYKDWNRRPSL
jgi:(S)-ureidoglycine aminohydrolase